MYCCIIYTYIHACTSQQEFQPLSACYTVQYIHNGRIYIYNIIYSCASVDVLGGVVYQEVLCGADRCGHVRGRVGMEM